MKNFLMFFIEVSFLLFEQKPALYYACNASTTVPIMLKT
jgi:hypothetical protein